MAAERPRGIATQERRNEGSAAAGRSRRADDRGAAEGHCDAGARNEVARLRGNPGPPPSEGPRPADNNHGWTLARMGVRL